MFRVIYKIESKKYEFGMWEIEFSGFFVMEENMSNCFLAF